MCDSTSEENHRCQAFDNDSEESDDDQSNFCAPVHPIFGRCKKRNHYHNESDCHKSLLLFVALVILLLLLWSYAWLRKRYTSYQIQYFPQTDTL